MSNQPCAQEGTSGLEEYQRLLALLDERRFEEAQVRGRVLLERPDLGTVARAKTHNLMCWTFIEGLKRPAPEAVLHGEEAVRLADILGERALQVQAICNLAAALYQTGDYPRARTCYGDMLAMLAADGSLLLFGEVIARQGLAQVEAVLGRLDSALQHLDDAAGLCQVEGAEFMLAEVNRRRALVLVRLDQPDQANQALEQISETAFASGPRGLWWRTHYRFTRARVELALGHWVTARTFATNTLALARELGDQPVLAECLCLLALVEAAEGRRDAPKRARQALTCAIHSGRRDVVDDVRDRLREMLATGL